MDVKNTLQVNKNLSSCFLRIFFHNLHDFVFPFFNCEGRRRGGANTEGGMTTSGIHPHKRQTKGRKERQHKFKERNKVHRQSYIFRAIYNNYIYIN